MKKMPVLFVGHGSPMNAVEENEFVEEWRSLAQKMPRPKAILSVSAHWYTEGTRVMTSEAGETIYDMYGFPKELYDITYPAKGAPELAKNVMKLISREVLADNSWGLDHGTWSVLHRIYPQADIPVFQLSVDRYASAEEHYQIGQQLAVLREQGVLIFGSGNVVHNLARVDWSMERSGYPWAEEFDQYITENIRKQEDKALVGYEQAGRAADLAVPILDHYAPLLYVLGASDADDQLTIFNQACVLGSLSMTGYLFGAAV
ncbi:4,5-DOPA dioxygenase extradiol [Aminipila butyrica]|uniref:4,5-DOPA dioxygenase extradiol n=1 Tax=Aminipila butyrica TaxID=433296 RepID=A0A858BZ41_9FIRM|nr:4,5-DOPA dioxygenase extradiol [Aminipila butyrica]QIB69346.1 4,5-DOPA dioxygenase extradiol [Aminipila butyrica]